LAAQKGRPPSDKIPPHLHELMRGRGIRTVSELAKKAGIQQSVLSRNLTGELKVSLKTALALVSYFNLAQEESEGFALLKELEDLSQT
jgi:hypothetical protein